MEVIYHPLVKRDIADALIYYDEIASRLADEFQAEVRSVIERAGHGKSFAASLGWAGFSPGEFAKVSVSRSLRNS